MIALHMDYQVFNLCKHSSDILNASEHTVISNFRHRYTFDYESAARQHIRLIMMHIFPQIVAVRFNWRTLHRMCSLG